MYLLKNGIKISEEEVKQYMAKFLSFTPYAWATKGAMAVLRRIEDYKIVYSAVKQATGIPTIMIGTIHYLEANNNFKLSIRDGSPLIGKEWVEDARKVLDPYSLVNGNWNVGVCLAIMERYNGLGYRKRGIETPYLWSGTDLYKKGKFVRDGVFDPNAVSKQVGGAVVFRMLYLKLIADGIESETALEGVVRW